MSYNKTTWIDNVTPLNAENLNNIENGIEKMYKATVNGKALSSNPTLTAEDVDALPSSTKIPIVDKKFSASSENAQSGKAVAEAIASIGADVDTSLFASAIQNTVSGGVLGINDIGALDHTVKVKLSGEEVENLLPSPAAEPLVMHTYNGDGSLVINGTVPSDNSRPLIVYISSNPVTLEKGIYTLDLGTATSQVYLQISLTDAHSSTYEEYQTDSTGKITFTVGDYNVVNALTLRPISGEVIDNLLVKPMFYKVNTLATSWTSKPAENNNVGYEPAIQFLGVLKNSTTYTMKFKCNKKGVAVKAPHPAIAYSTPTEAVTTGELQTITFTTNEYVDERKEYTYDATYGWSALLYAEYSPTDAVFTDFTIVEGAPTTDFTQVKLYRYGKNSSENKLEFTPSADGTVDVPSLAPYMSLVTDKYGLIITATYNLDTKNYIDKKFENFVNVAEVGA